MKKVLLLRTLPLQLNEEVIEEYRSHGFMVWSCFPEAIKTEMLQEDALELCCKCMSILGWLFCVFLKPEIQMWNWKYSFWSVCKTTANVPILAFNPVGQHLSQLHWKVVIIKIVHLFEELNIQLLYLFPLTHSGAGKKNTMDKIRYWIQMFCKIHENYVYGKHIKAMATIT